MTRQQVREQIRQGFGKWQNALLFTFTEVTQQNGADLVLSFGSISSYQVKDAAAAVFVASSNANQGQIVYDDSRTWVDVEALMKAKNTTTYALLPLALLPMGWVAPAGVRLIWELVDATDTSRVDLQYVTVHESGHWLLGGGDADHSSDKLSFMQPSVDYAGSVQMRARPIAESDIERLNKLYAPLFAPLYAKRGDWKFFPRGDEAFAQVCLMWDQSLWAINDQKELKCYRPKVGFTPSWWETIATGVDEIAGSGMSMVVVRRNGQVSVFDPTTGAFQDVSPAYTPSTVTAVCVDIEDNVYISYKVDNQPGHYPVGSTFGKLEGIYDRIIPDWNGVFGSSNVNEQPGMSFVNLKVVPADPHYATTYKWHVWGIGTDGSVHHRTDTSGWTLASTNPPPLSCLGAGMD